MPLTSIFCIIGAASISAFPLFSGFVAKSMVLAAAVEEGHPIVWMVLLFASAGVFHHSGIKIPFFAFFAHDSGIRCKEAPFNMLAAMFVAAFLCIAIGVYPAPLYALLPAAVNFDPYTAGHVLAQAQLLFFSALAFTYLKLSGLYPPEMVGINVDAEWSYRRLLPSAVRAFIATFGPIDHAVRHLAMRGTQRVIVWIFRHHGPEGVLAATMPSGAMVLGVVSVLAVFLVLYFVS
jgi:multicomponent Na+:H+ antiporter subunit D